VFLEFTVYSERAASIFDQEWHLYWHFQERIRKEQFFASPGTSEAFIFADILHNKVETISIASLNVQ